VLVLEAFGEREVPGLLGDPSRVGSAGRAGEMDPPGRELDEEQDVEGLQEHSLDREEVAGQHSPPLRSQELGPGETRPARRGPEASSAQDPPNRARTDPISELAELSLDSHASPSRVLPPEAGDEVDGLGIDRRSPRSSSTVGPLPPHELAVPAEESLGRDHERDPTLTREGAARRG